MTREVLAHSLQWRQENVSCWGKSGAFPWVQTPLQTLETAGNTTLWFTLRLLPKLNALYKIAPACILNAKKLRGGSTLMESTMQVCWAVSHQTHRAPEL